MKVAYFILETGEVQHVANVPIDDIDEAVEIFGRGKRQVPDDFDPARSWVDPATLEIRHYSAQGRIRYHSGNRMGHVWSPSQEKSIDLRTIEERKADLWQAVKLRRATVFTLVATSSSGIPYRIQKDKDNLANEIVGRDAGSVPDDELTIWRGDDNLDYPLDRPGLAAFAFDMRERGKAIYAHSWALDAAIKSAQTVEELSDIDIATGWP